MPKLPMLGAELNTPVARVEVLLARAGQAEQDGQREEAEQLYQRVSRIDPTSAVAITRLGVLAGEAGNLAIAVQRFTESLRIETKDPDTWFNLGIAQSRLGQTEEALLSFNRVVALSPFTAPGHLQRGAMLDRLGRHQEAVKAYDEALRLSPNDVEAIGQRGWTLQWCGRPEAALDEFDRAIALRPDFAEAWVSKAMLLMLLGDLPNGFAHYEWRWRLPDLRPASSEPEWSAPLWLGAQDLVDKTLLIHWEQGLGDVIQYCRYVPLVVRMGARVILAVAPELVDLMKTLDGVSLVVASDAALPAHDFHCPVMSLPLAFGTTLENVPSHVPYLRADPVRTAAWHEELAKVKGVRIGIVWAGKARPWQAEALAVDRRRSIALEAFAPLGMVDGCCFVSLQLGPPAAQAKSPPEGMNLYDYTDRIRDFADTAALIDNLDLVIAVDTSVAHLAGAMGKPVWLLNRFDTCWRWLLHRDDSPWYPSMRIFRQPTPGDWNSVIRSVARSLRAFAQGVDARLPHSG